MPLGFPRERFHDALGSFADRQITKLQQAVSNVSIDEVLSTVKDLHALGLIFVTRFVLYKQDLEIRVMKKTTKQSLEKLVKFQATKFNAELARTGVHFALLDVLPSVSFDDIKMPSKDEIKRAFNREAKKYHEDKSRQFDQQKRRSVSLLQAKEMMPKLNEAREFLLDQRNCSSFRSQLRNLFMHEIGLLPKAERSRTKKCVDEEKFGELRMMLDSFKRVDRRAATHMNVPVEEMQKSIHDSLVQEVRKTQATVQQKWNQGLLRELHEELGKLKSISQELAAYPEIVPEDLIRDISMQVNQNVKETGLEAQRCIANCLTLKDAMEHIWQFGSLLIELGHIFTHLGDFKSQAELEVTHALNGCYDKLWGANFMFELGMRLGQGKIVDPNKDGTIAKVLVNEFPHFKDVHTVMFNRETRATRKTVGDTLKVARINEKI